MRNLTNSRGGFNTDADIEAILAREEAKRAQATDEVSVSPNAGYCRCCNEKSVEIITYHRTGHQTATCKNRADNHLYGVSIPVVDYDTFDMQRWHKKAKQHPDWRGLSGE